MNDLSAMKKLSINDIELKQLFIGGVSVWKRGYTNQVPLSIDAGGAIYNSGLGYRNGYRLSSSGAEKTQSGSVVTGFIPAKNGDVIRMAGAMWGTDVSGGYSYIQFYDDNFDIIYQCNKYMNDSSANGISNATNADKEASSILTDENGATTFNIVPTRSLEAAYIRISASGDGASMIVTINEEIT